MERVGSSNMSFFLVTPSSKMGLAWLDGFNIRAAYKMTKRHVPQRGPDRQWTYPKSKDVLEECT